MARQQRKRLSLIIKWISLILLIFGLLGMAGVFSSSCRKENTTKRVTAR